MGENQYKNPLIAAVFYRCRQLGRQSETTGQYLRFGLKADPDKTIWQGWKFL